jgi:tRNA A-37 threonylcarbamoyl transferase component Bud32
MPPPDFNDRTGPNQVTMAAPPGADAHPSHAHSVRSTVDGATIPNTSVSSSQQRVNDQYIGKTLDGRYLVEALLGEGGMGVVYRGRHKVIDKRVAIKILRVDMAADAEMVERFLNEAKAASSIGNPHIVDISDFGRLDDGATFFVMEYLDGQSLADLMTGSGVIPVPRLVHIAKQIARGLAAAHARGIVHRDLKPDNVMLVVRGDDRDFAKVLDFGIAKVNSEAGRLTRAGSVFGTPHYMSPEQAAGVPVDQRTDIYSLGIILYEMASGKVPFDADNFMGILTQHMYKSPAPIRALIPQPQDVPPGLEAIVLKCLSKKVELRYQSMEEVVADLERAERGMVPEAVQEMMGRSGGFNVPADYFRKAQHPGGAGMMPATPPYRQKKPVLAMVIATCVVASAIIIGGVVWATSLRAASKDNGGAPGTSLSAQDRSPAGSPPTANPTATPPVDDKIAVLITVDPADAQIGTVDGKMQPQPGSITIGINEEVKIRIERKGYVSQVVTLKGSEIDRKAAWRVYSLKPQPGTAIPKSPAGAKPPAGTKPPTPALAAPPIPPVKPPTQPPANAPCDPPRFRDPFDGKCH